MDTLRLEYEVQRLQDGVQERARLAGAGAAASAADDRRLRQQLGGVRRLLQAADPRDKGVAESAARYRRCLRECERAGVDVQGCEYAGQQELVQEAADAPAGALPSKKVRFSEGPLHDEPYRDEPYRDEPSHEDGLPHRDEPLHDEPYRDEPPHEDGLPHRDEPPHEDGLPHRDEPPHEDGLPHRDEPSHEDGLPHRDEPYRDEPLREEPSHEQPSQDDEPYHDEPPHDDINRTSYGEDGLHTALFVEQQQRLMQQDAHIGALHASVQRAHGISLDIDAEVSDQNQQLLPDLEGLVDRGERSLQRAARRLHVFQRTARDNAPCSTIVILIVVLFLLVLL